MQTLSRDWACLFAPNINSFRRLVPGYWAPTTAFWGIDNRTTAIRAISGSSKSQRVEYRVPGADANPYLAAAGIFAAGFYGIEHEIEPQEPVADNAYQREAPENLLLPRSLWASAQRFRDNEAAHDCFGSDFVEHFASSREWESRQFQQYVTDWERKRYFEII